MLITFCPPIYDVGDWVAQYCRAHESLAQILVWLGCGEKEVKAVMLAGKGGFVEDVGDSIGE